MRIEPNTSFGHALRNAQLDGLKSVSVLDVKHVDAQLLSLSVFSDKTLLPVNVELVIRLPCCLIALNRI